MKICFHEAVEGHLEHVEVKHAEVKHVEVKHVEEYSTKREKRRTKEEPFVVDR